MKHILNLALLLTFALAQTASARIDLLWEIPTGTGQIPDFEASQSRWAYHIGGKDGSLALRDNREGEVTIVWFDLAGNLISKIELWTLRMPEGRQYNGSPSRNLLFSSSSNLIATIWFTDGYGMVVFTKTPQGVVHEFFSSHAQSNFTGNDNALIRFEDGKLKRYRFVDDQPVAPASQPVLGSVKTNDRYLLLDYTVAPNQKYHLGISKDLKTWEPLYDFTPASGQLSIELPRIILDESSFLKLK